MNIQLALPDEFAESLANRWDSLERWLLEAAVIQAYREGLISRGKVGQLLGLASRWDAEAFLQAKGVNLPYDEADLEQDLNTIEQIRAEGRLS